MRFHLAPAFVLLALAAMPAAAQERCGTPAGICQTEHGFYRLALPHDAQPPVPALIFLHGYGGSSQGAMKNVAMLARLAARGYALIAPEGLPRTGGRNRNWSVRDGGEYPRDDIAFLREVLDDAARRGVDRGRVLMAGFSRGASMVWDVACHAPDTARAYAPVSGAFWEPLPDTCTGPVELFHTHGWSDRRIPIEGRSVDHGQLTQGDLFASLGILRETLGCDPQMPDTAPVEADGTLWFRHWDHCLRGRLDLMLHPGGHRIPEGWLDRALDWFETQ